MRTLASCLLVAALAPPAVADDVDAVSTEPPRPAPRWTLDYGAQLRWFTSASAASLAPGSLAGPQLTFGRHLIRIDTPRRPLDLGLFIRFGGGSADGQIFQSLDTHIGQLAFTAGAKLDAAIWRPLRLVVEVDAGAAETQAIIGESLGDMAPVDDSAWAPIASATLGLEVTAVHRRRFYLGFRADAGYTFAAPVELHAHPRGRPPEDLSIQTMYAPLGHLDTSGPTLGLRLRGGF